MADELSTLRNAPEYLDAQKHPAPSTPGPSVRYFMNVYIDGDNAEDPAEIHLTTSLGPDVAMRRAHFTVWRYLDSLDRPTPLQDIDLRIIKQEPLA